jgi:iron complex outermembrane receptor protein
MITGVRSITFVVFLICGTWHADAQTPAAEPPRFVSDVVVTATRTETDVAKAPVSTSSVTSDELNARRIQTLDQGLNLLPGVYAVRARGASESATRATVRGFSGANRTLVLVDGQPLNDAYTGDVNWASLPVEDVDRIEVARGPASSLYGGNAMGGVVNILSRPIGQREFVGRIQFGTYDTWNGGLRYADRWRAFGVSAGIEGVSTNGYRSRVITITPGSLSAGVAATGASRTSTTTGATVFAVGEGGAGESGQYGINTKVEFTPRAGSFWSARYFEQHADYDFAAYSSDLRGAGGDTIDRGSVLIRDAGMIRQLSVTPGAFLQSPGTTRSRTAIVSGRQALGSWLLQVSGSAMNQPDNFTITPTAATATASGGPGSTSVRDSRTYAGSAMLSRMGSNGREFVGGVDYHRDWSDNREYALADWTAGENLGAQTFQSHGDTESVAGFVQARLPFGSHVTATAGGRFDGWRTFDGLTDIFNAAVPRVTYPARESQSLTGRVSLVAEPATDWIVRAVAGTAFRNPTVFELYRTFRLSSGTVFYAAPNLEPERNVGIESGITRRIGTRFSIDAIYFRNETSDLIYRKNDLASDPTGRTRVLVNAGEGVTNGVEVSSQVRPRAWMQLRAQYSYTRAIISRNTALPETEGKRVPFVPAQMTSVAALVAGGGWTASVSGRYVSDMYSLDTNADTVKGVMGSYSESASLDATVGYRFRRRIELFAAMENGTNRRDYVFYLTPARTISAGLRVSVGR